MIKKLVVVVLILVLLLGLIFIVLLNHAPYKVKKFSRELYGVKHTADSEASVTKNDFLQSLGLITVEAIHSGDLKVPLSNALNLKHEACSGIEDREITVPIFAYLIHHETFGYFLIDTGCASSYENNIYGPMKGPIFPFVMPETQLEKGQAIDALISGISSQIRGVFFTHLHFDHTSGLPALPDNLILVAGKGEHSLSIKGLLEPHHFKKNSTVNMIDFEAVDSLTTPLGKAIDVFGDHTFWAISTPGHSKGHVSYLVNTKEGPILVAGDAVIMNQSLELGVASGTSSGNAKQDQKTLEGIIAFKKANPQIKIMPGHDFMK